MKIKKLNSLNSKFLDIEKFKDKLLLKFPEIKNIYLNSWNSNTIIDKDNIYSNDLNYMKFIKKSEIISNKSVLFIDSISIKNKFQWKWIWTSILIEIENYCKDNNFQYIFIDSYKESTIFWEKNWFTLMKEFPIFNWHVQDFKPWIKKIHN